MKVSPQTFGVMVSRLLLDFEVEPVMKLADLSGEKEYQVPSSTPAPVVATSGLVGADGAPLGGKVNLSEAVAVIAAGHEGRKFRRLQMDFMGMPLKIWEEVPK